MINLQQLSQRDPRWAHIKLGTSKSTIGDDGCVLTSLAMLAGINDVGQANELMVKNGGFVKDNLVYWVKVPKVFPTLVFEWRNWSYTDAENKPVSDWIYVKGYPVIVEVDAAPIGSPRTSHFVVYVGDRKLIDLWDGKLKPTSSYPNTKGYILYKRIAQPLTLEEKVKAIIYSPDTDSQKISRLQALLPR